MSFTRRPTIFSSIGEFALKPESVRSVGDLTATYLAWRKDHLGNANAVMNELGLTRSTFYRLLANRREE